MNRKYLAPSIAWLMTIIAAPSFAQDVLSDARTNFANRQYLVVFNSLYDYRRSSEGTLVVDYMLAVSACHLTGQRRTAGGYLLSQLPEWYGPLGDGNWEMVRRQAEACPPPANPAEEPFAGIQGAADDGKSESLLASRSKEGSGDALPAAAVSPPEGMGELMDGQSYAYAGPQEQELTTDSSVAVRKCLQESIELPFDNLRQEHAQVLGERQSSPRRRRAGTSCHRERGFRSIRPWTAPRRQSRRENSSFSAARHQQAQHVQEHQHDQWRVDRLVSRRGLQGRLAAW